MNLLNLNALTDDELINRFEHETLSALEQELLARLIKRTEPECPLCGCVVE